MTIKTVNLVFKNSLSKRKATNRIILHHAAGSGMTVQQIHNMHVNSNGWSGIGYHFYVRKNGEVWQGRPIDTVGAHCGNNNSDSIGICFEGNFESETMNETQLKAGKDIVAHLKSKYPNATIYGHRDFNATACPGKNFPLSSFKTNSAKIETIVKEGNDVNTVKNGSKGTDVKILQRLLKNCGYNITIDGAFGAGTETAVKDFQKSHNLTADGIVGAKTWDVISSIDCVNSSADLAKFKTKIASLIEQLAAEVKNAR